MPAVRSSLSALLSLGLLLSSQADAASTLRCSSKLVSLDDLSSQVESKCGTPVSRDHIGYTEVATYAYGYQTGFNEVPVEEWIYGPRNGMYYYLRFEANRLVKIESKRGL